MEKLNFRQAYDLIIDAYFRDEIKPFDPEFCFCGTLNENNSQWGIACGVNIHYSGKEYYEMEEALFDGMNKYYRHATNGSWSIIKYSAVGEETLFKGMCEALEVLKEIHRNRNEDVDEEIPFKKRELLQTDTMKPVGTIDND